MHDLTFSKGQKEKITRQKANSSQYWNTDNVLTQTAGSKSNVTLSTAIVLIKLKLRMVDW